MKVFHSSDFKCTLCSQWFCPPYTLPYLMPCSHSLCSSCLERAKSNGLSQLVCPQDLQHNLIALIDINHSTKKALDRLTKEHYTFAQNSRLECLQTLACSFDETITKSALKVDSLKQLIEQTYHHQMARIRAVYERAMTDLNRPKNMVSQWKDTVKRYLVDLKQGRNNDPQALSRYVEDGRNIKIQLAVFLQTDFEQVSLGIVKNPRGWLQNGLDLEAKSSSRKVFSSERLGQFASQQDSIAAMFKMQSHTTMPESVKSNNGGKGSSVVAENTAGGNSQPNFYYCDHAATQTSSATKQYQTNVDGSNRKIRKGNKTQQAVNILNNNNNSTSLQHIIVPGGVNTSHSSINENTLQNYLIPYEQSKSLSVDNWKSSELQQQQQQSGQKQQSSQKHKTVGKGKNLSGSELNHITPTFETSSFSSLSLIHDSHIHVSHQTEPHSRGHLLQQQSDKHNINQKNSSASKSSTTPIYPPQNNTTLSISPSQLYSPYNSPQKPIGISQAVINNSNVLLLSECDDLHQPYENSWDNVQIKGRVGHHDDGFGTFGKTGSINHLNGTRGYTAGKEEEQQPIYNQTVFNFNSIIPKDSYQPQSNKQNNLSHQIAHNRPNKSLTDCQVNNNTHFGSLFTQAVAKQLFQSQKVNPSPIRSNIFDGSTDSNMKNKHEVIGSKLQKVKALEEEQDESSRIDNQDASDDEQDQNLLNNSPKKHSKLHVVPRIDFLRQFSVSMNRQPILPQVIQRDSYDAQREKTIYIRRMEQNRVEQAIQASCWSERQLELINYSLHDVNMEMYLAGFCWDRLEVVKLVRVALANEQFNCLLNFLLESKVTSLVVTGNNLTDLILDGLLHFVERNTQLKTVYLTSNYVNMVKCRNKVHMLKDKGMVVYI